MTSKAYRFCPTLEALERRDVPAGNVTGVVQNGHLILTGDGEDNVIEIAKGLENSIRILGLDGTTINGAGGLEDFGGAYKDVIINLQGGDDLVNLAGGGGGSAADVGRDLIFQGGSGLDTLTSEAGAVIGRDLIFRGGTELSSTTLDGVIVGRHARFTGNADVVVQAMNFTTVHGLLSVASPALAGLTLEDTTLGRLKVSAEAQAEVDLTFVFVGGNAGILGGAGDDLVELNFANDILGNLTIQTRGGNDTVEPDAQVGGNVWINFGAGANHELDAFGLDVYGDLTILSSGSAADDWDLNDVEVLGRTKLDSGGGNDTLGFDDCLFFGPANFLGGAGDDQVQVCDGNNVVFRGPTIFDLGDGADTLQLGDGIGLASFLSLATLQGGTGTDTLNDVSSDFDVVPVIQGF